MRIPISAEVKNGVKFSDNGNDGKVHDHRVEEAAGNRR
jgi:hypothetical protein